MGRAELSQRVAEQAGLDGAVRVVLCRQVGYLVHHHLGTAAAGAPVIDQDVPHGGEQPGARAAASWIERVGVPPCPQQRFLHRILRAAVITSGKPQCVPPKVPRMFLV